MGDFEQKINKKSHRKPLCIYIRRSTAKIFVVVLFIMIFIVLYISWINITTINKIRSYIDNGSITETVSKETIVKRETIFKEPKMDYLHFNNVQIGVENILQNPELPTGCEITSLATVLNYLYPDKNIDKVDLADNYLEKGQVGKTHPDEAFIGNPHNERYSFGANAPVLVNAAKKYYAVNMPNSDDEIKNLTGTEFKDLLGYTVSGYPVMVWGTIDLLEPYVSITWTVDGVDIPWQAQFHCMVLTGYDMNRQVYYVADPLKEGITEYNMDLLELRYQQLGKQAIVIY